LQALQSDPGKRLFRGAEKAILGASVARLIWRTTSGFTHR